jgi:integrase
MPTENPNRPRLLTAVTIPKLKAAPVPLEIPDTGCPGLRLVIHPTGRKTWIMRFRRPDGKNAKLTLGSFDPAAEAAADPKIGDPLTLAAAHSLAADVKRKRERGIDVIAAHKTEKRVRREAVVGRGSNLFPAAAREFIDSHKVEKTGQKPRRWRETAKRLGLDYPAAGGEPTIIKGGLCERWSEKAVTDVTEDSCYQLIREARDEGIPGLERRNKGKSNPRWRQMANAIGVMFKWLKSERRVTANPCIGLDRPQPPAGRNRVLNVKMDVRGADELRFFWAATDKVTKPFGPLLKLLLLTGCRRDELAKMTRDELTDDLAMIHLPGSRTKNHLPHDVPLAPLAQNILNGVKGVPNCRFLFSTNGKAPVAGFSKIKRSLDKAMLIEAQKERGEDSRSFELAPWRIHDLRRTAATGMAGIGIAPHIVEAVLNHVSGAKAGVAGVYNQEMYEPEKREALEKWASYIEAVVTGRTATVIRPPFRGRG